MAVTSPRLTQRGTVPLTEAEIAPQRMRALERANRIRRHKAALRRDLGRLDSAASIMEASRIVREIPDGTEHFEAGELLLAIRKMGKVKARPILARWGVSVWCPLTQMTERQRRGVACDLEDLARGRAHGHLGVLSEMARHILLEVARADEMGVTARDLGRTLGINGMSASALLNGLHVRGLISRERLTSKANLWLITAAGRRESERPDITWSTL